MLLKFPGRGTPVDEKPGTGGQGDTSSTDMDVPKPGRVAEAELVFQGEERPARVPWRESC